MIQQKGHPDQVDFISAIQGWSTHLNAYVLKTSMPTDTETAFDKIRYTFLLEILKKLRVE